jgi:hypothetical protein
VTLLTPADMSPSLYSLVFVPRQCLEARPAISHRGFSASSTQDSAAGENNVWE